MQKHVFRVFIPEKYVFIRVCFESPFTRMISNLKYKWPPGGTHLRNCVMQKGALKMFNPQRGKKNTKFKWKI